MIKAHRHDVMARQHVPAWRDATPPSPSPGRLRGCSYCGSMHPADLAAALAAGATVHWADRKYGWPHKVYADGVPNPHAGQPEVTSSGSGFPEPDHARGGTWTQRPDGRWNWLAEPRPAPALTHGKFYTEHLQDATPEERDVIERAMGMHFEFDEDGRGRVMWWAYGRPRPNPADMTGG